MWTFLRTAGAICTTLGLAGGGCSGSGGAPIPVQGTVETAGGLASVVVENRLGEVEIVVDPSIDTPEIHAWALKDGGGLVDRPLEPGSLVAATYEDVAGRPELRVSSVLQGRTVRGPGVRIRMTIPGIQSLTVRNAGGPVRITGGGGEVSVDNRQGTAAWAGRADIVCHMKTPVREPLRLIAWDGNAELEMPATSRGALDIVGARRIQDFSRGGTVTDATSATSGWAATLNGGTNPVRVRASGGVRVSTTP